MYVQPELTVRYLKVRETTFELHAHAHYTIATLLGGSISGRIADRPFKLQIGASALIDSHQPHEASTRRCELVSIGLSPVLVHELLTDLGWNHPDAHASFEVVTVHDESLASLARAFANELEEDRPGRAVMLLALARQLATYLLRSHLRVRRHPSLELSREGPVDRRIRRAIDLIHARYTEDVTLQKMADSVYLSEYHFAHLFKALTGFTPHAYLANARIERARELLLTTTMSVAQVARRVGYRSPSHFAHAFRSITGFSPTAFRAMKSESNTSR